MKSSLLILPFIETAFSVVSIVIAIIKVIQDLLMLSSRSFTTLRFAFKPVIHFELIFVKGIRCVSKFTVLHEDVQWLWRCLFKSLLYSTVIPLLEIR